MLKFRKAEVRQKSKQTPLFFQIKRKKQREKSLAQLNSVLS